ncbi:MAG TPA: Dot/Icm T4SS effector Zinc-dependent metalloprotease LegP [Geminicoccus sp.]|jgi:hypothetical protein|uniref:Dot/Icm T4SS effector Zinc-dependent metalloprotease LegP n=1 Tax=Geminicoccus sp. TaxID=2024832 RepID=UPI002E30C702|nr:Dot/Icm T4SS effector Zinc-dependent metalloprotease LegP [Geminicoccus sp.]HEX2524690.1 Dot/Icm T4SS effector Zinc-dependent metalloprotease LegP [Geminicoccus sp.]
MAESNGRTPRGSRSKGERDPNHSCEFCSGPIAGSIFKTGMTFRRKPVLYADVEGLAIFEGDIVVGRTGASAPGDLALQSVGISGAQFRWPNATVPFEIDAGLPNQQRVTDAIAHWEANTRIRFVPRTAAHADYVRFVNGGGCSSWVGRQGGPQDITLGPNCSTGNAIHEIGHAVGLWHEQSREDRDGFVQVVWANIDPSMQHNFTQHITDGDDLGPYDYGSVMHYPPTAFSTNGQATLVPTQPLPPGVAMGQRSGLSAGDIAGVEIMYPKPPAQDPIGTIKEVAKDPVTDPPMTFKEVRKDPVRDPTIKEIRKDPISDPPTTIKEIRKDPIQDTRKELLADPTIKEGAFDPGPFPGPGPVINPGLQPFVLGTGHQAPYFADQGMSAEGLVERAQAIAETLAAMDQDRAALAREYDQIVAMLGGGQGAV